MKLVLFDSIDDEGPVAINPDHIVAIEPDGEGGSILTLSLPANNVLDVHGIEPEKIAEEIVEAEGLIYVHGAKE